MIIKKLYYFYKLTTLKLLKIKINLRLEIYKIYFKLIYYHIIYLIFDDYKM